MTSCCRLCYSETEILLPLYDENGTDNKGMAGTISRFLEIELKELSTKICVCCWSSMDNFQKFHNMVAEKQLQNFQNEFSENDEEFKVDFVDMDEDYGGPLDNNLLSECELEEEASDTSNASLKRSRSNDSMSATGCRKQSPKCKKARINVVSMEKLNKQAALQTTDLTKLHTDILKIIEATETTITKDITQRLDAFKNNTRTIINRILNFILILRKENGLLKNKFVNVSNVSSSVLPINPINEIDTFWEFEKELKSNMEKSQALVLEFISIPCTNSEKFVRTCWRKLLTDEVAENFSWRGTMTKKSVRELTSTFSIRSAFKQKYFLSDENFDKICQKFFQYAHDRISKMQKYEESKLRKNVAK